MLTDYYDVRWRIERKRSTCIGPYIDGYAASLGKAGYPRDSIRKYVCNAHRLAQWSDRRAIKLASWNDTILSRFRRHLSPLRMLVGLKHLLRYVRECAAIESRPSRPSPDIGGLNDYFRNLWAIEQKRSSCIGPYIDDFAVALAEAGYSRQSIVGYLYTSDHLARWADRHGIELSSWNDDTLVRFRRHLSQCKCTKASKGVFIGGLAGAKKLLIHLRARGVVAVGPRPRHPYTEISERFVGWLRKHRGIASATNRIYQNKLRPFIVALGEDPSKYSVTSIREFVLEEVRKGRRNQVRESLTVIRSFLRFLVAEGFVQPGIEHCVPRVPRLHLSSLPRYLEPDDLERVLLSCDLTTEIGLRDRAILLLLSRLGLRAGDIVRVTLDDFDWKAGTLRMVGKGRREVRLPLPQDVGDAVLAYLERGRRAALSDRVFLTARYAPRHPFPGPASVSSVVSRALKRAGIRNPPSRGANLLRHTAATIMLRAGGSLDAVAAVLRHRSPQTTAHYAKIDLGMLQQIAQPWPGGASC